MTLPVAHLDVETRSTVDLKKAGLYRYFEDETTEVIAVRWRIGEYAGDENNLVPLCRHIRDGGKVAGHNIVFDREAWNKKIAPWLTWKYSKAPLLPIEQTDCTMSRCAALSIPQGLEQAGMALKAKIQKDKVGHRLMMKMCKPRSISEDGRITWWESAEDLEKLGEYCAQDVESEAELDRILLQLSESERKVWILDQKINGRGVQLDVEMVERAHAVALVASKEADKLMKRLTEGAASRCTEVAKIVAWINSRGVPCESIAKGEVEELLVKSDLFGDETVRQVVELRRAAAKSSVAKYEAMLNSVCRDGRVRGTLNYHGASTGRWAGRLIQPQNLPRILDAASDVIHLHKLLSLGYDDKRAYQAVALTWDNPLEILSRALRSMIVAAPGKKLVGGDYSNIEGRVNAWLAGEHWKVRAFREYDEGSGWDLYVLSYARAFDIDPKNVDKFMRQYGKVMELALGYQGGVRAFQKMAANYGIAVSDDRADELKLAWRATHPAIVEMWYELQDAAIDAVRNPGMKVPACHGRVAYLSKHGFLWCRLPSGRNLAYPYPRIVWAEETAERSSRPQVEFEGVDSLTKKWGPHRLYGGLQCENIIQAIARDILVEGMFRLEEAGYPLVLTVHDENICEVDESFGSPDELAALMAIVPEWAEGLPVAVSPWEDYRYVK
jgi:DNA polymerase